jgi:hypothetical protein
MSSVAFGGASSARGGKMQSKSCETSKKNISEEARAALNVKPNKVQKIKEVASPIVVEEVVVVTEKKPRKVTSKKTIPEAAPVESGGSSSMDIENI